MPPFPIMPRLSFGSSSLCSSFLPSLPHTVRDLEVPPLFRRRFILGGYRPVGQPWRLYLLSLFQIHNETLNVWSPLLAANVVAIRFMVFTVLQGGGPEGQGLSVDVSSLPLVLYAFSTLAYLSSSAAARLLHPHSEHAHYSLFFLNNVGGAIYLYCCALALHLYSSDPAWTQSMLGKVFLPAAAFLCWTSCAALCYAELHPGRTRTSHRTLHSLTRILAISPVAHRLAAHSWTSSTAVSLHLLQVVLSLLSAFIFSSSLPECFFPGGVDVFGHSRQLFHVLLSLCGVAQQEALFLDFQWRRPAMLRLFGEERLLLAGSSILCLTFCCGMTALVLRRRGQAQLHPASLWFS